MIGVVEALLAALAAAGALLGTGIGIYFAGRRSGAAKEEQKRKDGDNDRAREIEDAADQARRSDGLRTDPARVLQDAGRLRD